MLQDEKHASPIHPSGPNLNCPLVDNRCDHCGVSILAQNPDIQTDEIMASGQHQERRDGAMLPPPPPYQVCGEEMLRPRSIPSTAGAPSASRLEGDETQPASGLASSRVNRRRPHRLLRLRITVRFRIGGDKEREKTVSFLDL